MDTIESYLNTVFAQAPDTAQVRQLKADMLANMQEKYQELKNAGRTENEAVGAVISEFGNVEELFAEMGIAKDMPAEGERDDWPLLQLPQVLEIKEAWRVSARGIGFGVLLVLLGVAVMLCLFGVFEPLYPSATNASVLPFELDIFGPDSSDTPDASTAALEENRFAYLPVVVFFLFIIPAFGAIVFYGMRIGKFDYLERGEFHLDSGLRPSLEAEHKQAQEKSSKRIAAGVVFCLGAVLVILIIAMFVREPGAVLLGAGAMIALIGLAVYLFITGGMQRGIYDQLLRRGDYAAAYSKPRRIIESAAAFYWPLAVIVYLLWSFLFHAWTISWILWPVAGILFGGFAAMVDALAKERRQA
jgi:hypothetical protein